MPVSPATMAEALLGFFAVLVGYHVYADSAEYRRFKQLTDSAARQKRYAVWILKSFLLFGGGAVLALFLVGRLGALAVEPREFSASIPQVHLSGDIWAFVTGLAVSGLVSGTVLAFVLRRRAKPGESKTVVIGDIQALLPRNGAERFWTALLSLNAGLSEELFFRLMIPLLLVIVTGNVLLSFVAAGLIFGLVHFYQGLAGIAVTAVIGALMSAIYLATGSIWIAMAVHAFIDLNGLVLQPLLMGKPAR